MYTYICKHIYNIVEFLVSSISWNVFKIQTIALDPSLHTPLIFSAN